MGGGIFKMAKQELVATIRERTWQVKLSDQLAKQHRFGYSASL